MTPLLFFAEDAKVWSVDQREIRGNAAQVVFCSKSSQNWKPFI